ncbi:MAG: glycosyltransferase family 87 protein [Planctomycetota bacterium]|nr:glycosyltransferase family 87 protein [Planctomycetota bacterium]
MTMGPSTRRAAGVSPGANPFPGDIGLFYRGAHLISQGRNPYTADPTYSTYPPLWMGYSYLASVASRSSGIPFGLFFKGIDILADLGTTALIFLALVSAGRAPRTAFWLTTLFACNPVSIIITSLHGPNDPVILFLIVLACWWADRNRFSLAYLALGVGIAIKVYPVLLVPFFLLRDPSPLSRKGIAAFLIPLPFMLALIPFWLEYEVVVRQVGAYGGVTDFGYLSIIRTWMILHREGLGAAPELWPAALKIGKVSFLLIYAYILVRYRRYALARSCLAVFLLFLCVYGGISAQYHIWVIAPALLPGSGFRWKALATYSVLGAVAILIFYSIFHPGMFLGEVRSPLGVSSTDLWIHIGMNAILWVVTVAWAARVILQPLGVGPPLQDEAGTSG